MTITPVTVEGFPRLPKPFNNITPFTYRDGLTYLEVLERLRSHVSSLVREVNEALDGQAVEIIDELNELAEAVDNALAEQADQVNNALAEQADQVNDAVDRWMDITIENNDQITYSLVDRVNTATRKALERLSKYLDGNISVRSYSGTDDAKISDAVSDSLSNLTYGSENLVPNGDLSGISAPLNGDRVAIYAPFLPALDVSRTGFEYDTAEDRFRIAISGTSESNTVYTDYFDLQYGRDILVEIEYASHLEGDFNAGRAFVRWFYPDETNTTERIASLESGTEGTLRAELSAPEGTVQGTLIIQTYSDATAGNLYVYSMNVQAISIAKRAVNVDADLQPDSNIPRFWDASVEGEGTITREGVTFHVTPRPTADTVPVNNLYVDSVNGDDDNDGLSPSFAFSTIDRAYQVIRQLNSQQVNGAAWVVNLTGTFGPAITMTDIPDFPHSLTFAGEPLSGNGAPSTVIRQGSTNRRIGLRFEPFRSWVKVRRIHFADFTEYGGSGIYVRGAGRFEADDCTFADSDAAITIRESTSFRCTHLKADNCGGAFRALYSASGDWKNIEVTNSDTGFHMSRNAVAHVDYCDLIDCTKGIIVETSSRAGAIGNEFIRCGTGVYALGSAEWVRDDTGSRPNNFYVGTPKATLVPFSHRGFSKENHVGAQAATAELVLYRNTEQTTHGVMPMTPVMRTPPGNHVVRDAMVGRGKVIRVKVWGLGNTTDGAVALYIMNMDASVITELNTLVLDVEKAPFVFEAFVYTRDLPEDVDVTTYRQVGNRSPQFHTGARKFDGTLGVRARVGVMAENGTVEIHGLEMAWQG